MSSAGEIHCGRNGKISSESLPAKRRVRAWARPFPHVITAGAAITGGPPGGRASVAAVRSEPPGLTSHHPVGAFESPDGLPSKITSRSDGAQQGITPTYFDTWVTARVCTSAIQIE